ncbi:hypothetical protein CM19_12815 [Candidatus Acidianus copahuensis]|uniref:HEAT repeat domain-containing protein n=1 Tax=Candidatus Acidianus copahuensis TaxID=1160895 RepID=A0A031LHH2_9CREN|nr:hypothetical protein [Candidatus Acidianus copahuensis]EZQ01607.1 hypothetical protein CM19_12815 [Candidatus Acidianus copahuensis]
MEIQDLIYQLSSRDKNVKHEAWLETEKIINSGNLQLLLNLLCFTDHGTRYRAWNLLPKFLDRIKANEVRERLPCLLEMLKDEDINVRRLTWYNVLPQIFQFLDKEELKRIRKYCEEVASDDWKELLDETCREIEL